jgi:serine acetyltransferase
MNIRSYLKALNEDLERNRGNIKGSVIVSCYRTAHFLQDFKRSSKPLWVLGLPFLIFYRLVIQWVLGTEIPSSTSIGPGLVIFHGQGLVINSDTIVGSNVTLRQNTTVGSRSSRAGIPDQCPIIEDNVDVGPNVVILGNIRIGNGAIIGAGSVVVKDVPSRAVVAGNPAKVIRGSEAYPVSSSPSGAELPQVIDEPSK